MLAMWVSYSVHNDYNNNKNNKLRNDWRIEETV